MNKEVYEPIEGKIEDAPLKKSGPAVVYLVAAIVLGLIAVGLLVLYFVTLGDLPSNFDGPSAYNFYNAFIVFAGHVITPVMSLIMYFDAKRGRKNNWLTIVLLVGSFAFTVSMYADLTYYFIHNSPKLYGLKYQYLSSYAFNRYYFPTALTPFFVWLMVRWRRRLDIMPQYADSDTHSERTVRKAESVFYVITFVLALTLLIGALIGLVTSGGWGALVSMLWGWMLAVPLWISLMIWAVLFHSVKSLDKKGAAESLHNQE